MELKSFIETVFNYYNGRINFVVPAALQIIDYDPLGNDKAACSLSPNIVRVFPATICRFTQDINNIKGAIVECIIHELYHVDQVIFRSRLIFPKYVMEIENQVESMTNTYIAMHLLEIKNNFGVDLSYMNFNRTIYPNNFYRRTTIVDHLISCLDDIIPMQDAYINIIKQATNIDITMNNAHFKMNLRSGDIFTLDNFLYVSYFRYFRRTSIARSIRILKGGTVEIQISFNGQLKMVELEEFW